MSKLLIEEAPLQVLPSLAMAVGLNEAIILQQIHYWLGRANTKIDGHTWVYKTVQEWAGEFPFWSEDTISRALKKLRTSGVVVAEHLSDNARDRSLFYRIDYTMLDALGAECKPAKCGNGDAQNAVIDSRKMRECSIKAETTTETTAESSSAKPQAHQIALVDKKVQDENLQELCKKTWATYAHAYLLRYGIKPIRNATVNAQVKQLAKRLGSNAPEVACFFVDRVGDAYVIKNFHALGLLLKQAEAYHTQWATGQTITNTKARQADQSQANFDAASEAVAMVLARRSNKNE